MTPNMPYGSPMPCEGGKVAYTGTADGGTAPQAGQAGFFIVEYLS